MIDSGYVSEYIYADVTFDTSVKIVPFRKEMPKQTLGFQNP